MASHRMKETRNKGHGEEKNGKMFNIFIHENGLGRPHDRTDDERIRCA